MHKRLLGVYCALLLLMTISIFRIYSIVASDYITMAVASQGKYRVDVATVRGVIYDREMRPLVNESYRYIAAVAPTPQAAAVLLEKTPEDSREAVLKRLADTTPFVLDIPDNKLYAKGIDVFRVPNRYSNMQIATHVIGYLGSDGKGVAGVEKSFDEVLAAAGTHISVSYRVDAAGRLMESNPSSIIRDRADIWGGVVLTLDRDIQTIAEDSLRRGCEKGAVVVMDVRTGDILAMASVPVIDPNNIADSLHSEDSPFLNRAICGYNIGSVFKIVMSAAALESGISPYEEHECMGYTNINGQIFKCNFNAVHGKVNMRDAMEVSCNSYFISLIDRIEPAYALSVARTMGIGTYTELAPYLLTQSGNLPTSHDLSLRAAYANFSFGQGSSLATPLQMAQIVSVMANGGLSVTPRLILGTTEDGFKVDNPTTVYVQNKLIQEKTAKIVQELMISVIEDGSGKNAKPFYGGAGGKTSSAQTGHYVGEDEIVHAWFAGFYPAYEPKYSIVVFVENGKSGESIAGPIFKSVVDGITAYKNRR